MADSEAKSDSSEAEVRAILDHHFRRLTKAMLSPVFHRILKGEIVQRAGLLTALRREARRKKPTKRYLDFCRYMTMQAYDLAVGPLGNLDRQQIIALKATLDLLIAGMRNASKPKLDPTGFLSLQKKLFVAPRKRGPKRHEVFDEAYRRSLKSETIRSIAQDLEPDAYRADTANTMQRFYKAIKRRELAARAARKHRPAR
jgi:hypothetical protein